MKGDGIAARKYNNLGAAWPALACFGILMAQVRDKNVNRRRAYEKTRMSRDKVLIVGGILISSRSVSVRSLRHGRTLVNAPAFLPMMGVALAERNSS